jgi:hypothetical protein
MKVADLMMPEDPNKNGFYMDDRVIGQPTMPRYYVDGVYVADKELFEFADAVRKMKGYKNCKFGWDIVHTHRSTNKLAVYLPGEQYVWGVILFNGVQYIVDARSIRKARGGSWKAEYSQSGSKSVKTALVKVRKTVVPYTLKELTEQMVESVFANWAKQSRDEYRNLSTSASSTVTGQLNDINSPLSREIRAMLNSGYQFVGAGVRDMLEAMVTAQDTAESVVGNAFVGAFVYSNGGMVCVQKAAPGSTIRKIDRTTFEKMFKESGELVRYETADQLPEDIMSRIATLNIVSKNTFVEGVGQRISDDAYFVVDV